MLGRARVAQACLNSCHLLTYVLWHQLYCCKKLVIYLVLTFPLLSLNSVFCIIQRKQFPHSYSNFMCNNSLNKMMIVWAEISQNCSGTQDRFQITLKILLKFIHIHYSRLLTCDNSLHHKSMNFHCHKCISPARLCRAGFPPPSLGRDCCHPRGAVDSPGQSSHTCTSLAFCEPLKHTLLQNPPFPAGPGKGAGYSQCEEWGSCWTRMRSRNPWALQGMALLLFHRTICSTSRKYSLCSLFPSMEGSQGCWRCELLLGAGPGQLSSPRDVFWMLKSLTTHPSS